MSTRLRILVLIACAISAAAAIVVFMHLRSGAAASARGSEDSEFSRERVAWEIMRLADPRTGRVPRDARERELAFARTIPAVGSDSKRAGILDYDWRQRGPWNIGGRTRALAIDVSDTNVLLAGGVSGRMWRSTDQGHSWTRTTGLDQDPSITCLAQDTRPGHTNVWYCGSGELVGASESGAGAYFYGDGLYKSTDRGLSWVPLTRRAGDDPAHFDNIFDLSWRVATDPSDTAHDVVYAAVFGTIERSTDGGNRWSYVVGGPSIQGYYSGYFTDVAVGDSGVVYATISSDGRTAGVWRGTRAGAFVNITPPDWPADYNRTAIGISKSNPNVVYFVSETPGHGSLGFNYRGDSLWHSLWKYTYRSGDGSGTGGVWENLTDNIPQYGGWAGDFNSQSSYDLVIAVDPVDENTVFLGGTNVIRSTDGFSTPDHTSWIGGYENFERDSSVIERYSYPGHHPDEHVFVFEPGNPNVMYTGSDGGVHRTDDCLADTVRWSALANGYLTTQFFSIAVDHDSPGNPMIIGGMQDNGTWMTASTDERQPWTEMGSSDGAYCAFADGGRSVYVSKQLGRIYRVTLDAQGRATGQTRIDPAGPVADDYLFINPFAIDPNDRHAMVLPIGNALWYNGDLTQIPMDRTVSATEGWDRLAASMLPDTVVISSVAFSTTPAHRLYYGTATGRLFRLDEPSADAAPSEITGATFPNGYVSSISVDPDDADRIVVAFSNYDVQSLFSTTDGGITWESVGGNLEQHPDGTGDGPSVRSIQILHRSNGTLWLVGTSTGLYSTSKLDGMNTFWEWEGSTSIGNEVVDMIDARQSDGFVAVGTHGAGVFSTSIPVLAVERRQIAGTELSIESVQPNPARDRATIDLLAPTNEAVTLELVDERGAIASRRSLVGTGGRTRLALDLADIRPGAYVLRIRSRSATATRRMMVVR